jgi:hypothetical protein
MSDTTASDADRETGPSEEVIEREYGSATIEGPEEVVAATFGTWEITYTAGAVGMDDGSQLKVASNMSSDWGRPQFDDPTADNYATVETSADATVEARWDPDGYIRPLKDAVTIDVYDGSIAPGDTITLTLGETAEGSMGHRAQSFPERGFELAVLVDAFESGEPVPLPERLTFDVVAGAARRLLAFAPTNAEPGDAVEVSVRAEDFWGNTAAGYDAGLELRDGDEVLDLADADGGVATLSTTVDETGVTRLTVADPDRGFEATTNPIRVGLDDGEPRTYWGDIHGQSGETVGTGTIREYFEYVRDCAHMDFTSHAANDFQITDDFWETIRETVHEFNDPEEFVTFLCYEWSPNTSVGGDHNVYFRGDETEIHRSSSWQIADGYEKHEGTHPVSALYDRYEGRDDVLLIPHQGGRPATLELVDSDLTPFVEIGSVWGIFEWYGEGALERSDVGFVGGSDDHTGRPGASYPTNKADWAFPIKGPVMAARADDLTREGLWDAFTGRQVYATTGARCYLDVQVGDGDGATVGMGRETTVEGAPTVDVTVNGTAPIRRVDLFRGGDRVATESFVEGDDRVEVRWTGARGKDRHKVQDWSGGLSLSDGRVLDVEPFGFDHPTQGVTERTDRVLRWDGGTAGNYQGLRLDLSAPDDAELAVRTDPASTAVELGDLADGPHVVDAGFLDRELVVRRTGAATERDVAVTFDDADVEAGDHPYYVRVWQDDGEMAWSSPVFVTVE